MKRAIAVLLSTFTIFSCEEKILEYHEDNSKVFQNDLLHGDLVGKVKQISSGALVYVSQLTVIDSAQINPVDGSFVFRDLRAGNYDLRIVADNFRHYTRANVVIPGGTITYLGEVDLSKVPDLVSSFYPEDNAEIVYDWRYGRIAISVMFTRPMDRASVEASFSTDPPSEGIFHWGTYTYAPYSSMYASSYYDAARPEYGATITTFSKVTSMTYILAQRDSYSDTLYTVRISTAAHDTSENHLRFPLVFSFRTVQSYTTIYGIQSTPTHGDINVEPLQYSGIRILFPRRMDPPSTEAATMITPPMNRVFLWPQENELLIYPGGPFLSDSTISVSIAANARDKDGAELGTPYHLSFRTAPFAVASTSPGNGTIYVSRTSQVWISFNSYVNLSSVSGAVSITPPVAGSYAYDSYSSNYDNPSRIFFTPSTQFAANTKYTVTVTTGVRDLYDVPMKAPYTFSFVTRPN